MLSKVIEDAKFQWILSGLWTSDVIEAVVTEEDFPAEGKEPKLMLAQEKVQGVLLLFGKNNFLLHCSIMKGIQEQTWQKRVRLT
jgi:hypothetical protein